jgi:hypothetical protein
LKPNNQLDDFVTKEYLNRSNQSSKKHARRLIFSANKTGGNRVIKQPISDSKYQPYEDLGNLSQLPRRRLNTGLMLKTLKQSFNLYGQVAGHIQSAEASELASTINQECE